MSNPLHLRSVCQVIILSLLACVSVALAQTHSDGGPTADSYYQQGEALYKAEKYREALPFYLKAAEKDPSMSSAWYRIGWIYNDMEEYNSAIDPLKRVIAAQPNNAAANFELGYAYRKVERFNEALVAFTTTFA